MPQHTAELVSELGAPDALASRAVTCRFVCVSAQFQDKVWVAMPRRACRANAAQCPEAQRPE